MCFVNKMDRIGANFYRTVDMVKTRLEATLGRVAPARRRGGPESNKPFAGLIDLVKMKALIWRDEELGAQVGRGRHPRRSGSTRPTSTARNCSRRSPPATTS
ncbi:MAG: hypothetical protein R2713_17200 [Ilumatobacteraceae bacterium]